MPRHSAEAGYDMTGPSLAHILGKRVGTVSEFARYSPALKETKPAAGTVTNMGIVQ